MTVCELRPERYPLAEALVSSCVRHRTDPPGSWRREDAQRLSRELCNLRWEMVAPDDALVAYAAAWEVRSHRFRFDLVVQPEQRRHGLGSTLFETVLAAVQSNGAEILQARADSADVGSLAFLARRDFREVHRMVAMHGVPAVGDETILAPRPVGLEILTAVECEQLDSAFWSQLHAAHVRAATDWPDPDPGRPAQQISVEQFQRLFADHGVPPEQVFVARLHGKWIGYTGVAVHPADPRMARLGPTAVDPGHRGRGVATALKAAALAWAARAGFMRAESRSANPALLRVNAKLGLEIQDAEVRLVRDCHPARRSGPLD